MHMQTVVYSVLTHMQVNTGIMVSILSSNNLCTVADNGEPACTVQKALGFIW